jgi:hypothetical protein
MRKWLFFTFVFVFFICSLFFVVPQEETTLLESLKFFLEGDVGVSELPEGDLLGFSFGEGMGTVKVGESIFTNVLPTTEDQQSFLKTDFDGNVLEADLFFGDEGGTVNIDGNVFEIEPNQRFRYKVSEEENAYNLPPGTMISSLSDNPVVIRGEDINFGKRFMITKEGYSLVKGEPGYILKSGTVRCGKADGIRYYDLYPGAEVEVVEPRIKITNFDDREIYDNCKHDFVVRFYEGVTSDSPLGPKIATVSGDGYLGRDYNGFRGDYVVWTRTGIEMRANDYKNIEGLAGEDVTGNLFRVQILPSPLEYDKYNNAGTYGGGRLRGVLDIKPNQYLSFDFGKGDGFVGIRTADIGGGKSRLGEVQVGGSLGLNIGPFNFALNSDGRDVVAEASRNGGVDLRNFINGEIYPPEITVFGGTKDIKFSLDNPYGYEVYKEEVGYSINYTHFTDSYLSELFKEFTGNEIRKFARAFLTEYPDYNHANAAFRENFLPYIFSFKEGGLPSNEDLMTSIENGNFDPSLSASVYP